MGLKAVQGLEPKRLMPPVHSPGDGIKAVFCVLCSCLPEMPGLGFASLLRDDFFYLRPCVAESAPSITRPVPGKRRVTVGGPRLSSQTARTGARQESARRQSREGQWSRAPQVGQKPNPCGKALGEASPLPVQNVPFKRRLHVSRQRCTRQWRSSKR